MQTEEEKYRAAPGLNYSLLADYADSPDRALMPREPKGYFEVGKVFETVFQDEIEGTNQFAETWFVADLKGAIPDKIVKWFDEVTDLATCFTYNKDGFTRSGTQKNVHAWLDACLEYPGKRPVSQTMMKEIKAMVSNMLKMEIMGAPLVDILQNCQFQVPLYSEQNGIKKKALFDIVAQVNMGGQPTMICFDIKTAANLGKFRQSFKSRYIWQHAHYLSVAKANYKNVYNKMVFLVASKEKPYIAKPFEIADKSMGYVEEKYDDLCLQFDQWDKGGRPAKGWLPMEQLTVWVG